MEFPRWSNCDRMAKNNRKKIAGCYEWPTIFQSEVMFISFFYAIKHVHQTKLQSVLDHNKIIAPEEFLVLEALFVLI